MAIQSKSDKFHITFIQKYGPTNREYVIDHYFHDESEFYQQRETSCIELKENQELSVRFESSDSNLKFYMDGLDTLSEQAVELDYEKGEVYLVPSSEPVPLFGHTDEFFPLIPGYYRIVVESHDRRYYSWVKILPKQMSETQWEIMKEEVDNEMKGLAQDIIMRKMGVETGNKVFSNHLLGQYLVIKNRFTSVMAALSDLYFKVNYRIHKKYVMKPKEKARIVDEVTIKYRLSHPENDHMLKTPLNRMNYDLPENRLLKKIVQYVMNALSELINALEQLEKNILHEQEEKGYAHSFRTTAEMERTLKEVENLKEKASKMRGAFQWICKAPWFSEVNQHRSTFIPHVMNSDARYRALYQLYRDLKNDQIKLDLDESYSYQWKRTDKLYEIWGYIQFINALKGIRLGYTPVEGWIFNQKIVSNRILIPTLPSSTEVLFKKDNIHIKTRI